MDIRLPGSSVHGDSPGKNTEVGCHAILQGNFPTQGSNSGLLHCKRILYRLSHQESPMAVTFLVYWYGRRCFHFTERIKFEYITNIGQVSSIYWDNKNKAWTLLNKRVKSFKASFDPTHSPKTESIFPPKDMICLCQPSLAGEQKPVSQRHLFMWHSRTKVQTTAFMKKGN